jgi:DNA helicase II / ATP-dependent DNA helicase PcrA
LPATTPRQYNFKRHVLEGSYRLPYRISECIKPVSQKIKLQDHEDADVITPYKGSPPGARPIVIYADSNESAAKKILHVLDCFKVFDVINLETNPQHKITILEKDIALFNALGFLKRGVAETDTILRLKGLEKRCVLWSTSIKIDHNEEINNFVYTIMTRTCGILLIVIVKDLFCQDYFQVIKELKKDRLILWDLQTKIFYESMF